MKVEFISKLTTPTTKTNKNDKQKCKISLYFSVRATTLFLKINK